MRYFIVLSFVALSALYTAAITCGKETFIEKVIQHNMSTLEWEEEEWPNEPFYDYLTRCIDYQRNLQSTKKRRAAFTILKKNRVSRCIDEGGVLSDITTWDDLNLLRGSKNRSVYLADRIDRTCTEIGKVTLMAMIAEPLETKLQITQRQSLVKELLNDHFFFTALNEQLVIYQSAENLLLSFWLNDPLRQTVQRNYFKIPMIECINEALNKSETALLWKNVFEHYARIMCCVSGVLATTLLPLYSVLRFTSYTDNRLIDPMAERLIGNGGVALAFLSCFQNRFLQAGASMIAGAHCGLKVRDEFEWARGNFILYTYLQEKIISVSDAVTVLINLRDILASNKMYKTTEIFAQLNMFLQKCAHKEECLHRLLTTIQSSTFHKKTSIFSHYGRILVAYKLMHDLTYCFEKAICAVGELDALMSIARLYKEYEHERVNYTFVNFDTECAKPIIVFDDLWNPFLNQDKAVVNSIALGADKSDRNLIITGPNAGGKSTLMTAIAINLILAQTIGICAASLAHMSIFSVIITYLNITDDVASGQSLFKSQVMRAEHIVRKAATLINQHYGFFAFDEMFNGTDPQVGAAISYSVAKNLGKLKHAITVLTTHFPLLTTLETEGFFSNYTVTAHVDAFGTIHYPFLLEQGVSQQNIALDMVKQAGFESTIIDEANVLLSMQGRDLYAS